MDSFKMVETVVSEFFNRVGHGQLAELQKKLKLGKNYFSRWRSYPNRVRLLTLANTLVLLGIEPADFFASAFGPGGRLESHGQTGILFDMPLPSGTPPPGVEIAFKRLEELETDGSAAPSGRSSCGIDRKDLERLNILRLDDANKVNKILERAMVNASMELLPEVLAAYGVTFRQLDELSSARWAFFAAFRGGEGNMMVQASILQKYAWVEDTEGNRVVAMENLRRASGIFTELAAWNEVGKVLVDQAVLFYHYGDFSAAIRCNRSAITKLDEDEYENRFSAYEVQALCYLELRLKDEALESLDRARELADKCSSAARTRLIWTDVYARREVLSFLESAASFEEIAKFFHESGDVLSEILAVLEYVNCYLLAGNNAVAISAAQALKRFAFRETSHIVDAAIMNVYRAALEGQNIVLLGEVLTATLVTVKAAVEDFSTAASPN